MSVVRIHPFRFVKSVLYDKVLSGGGVHMNFGDVMRNEQENMTRTENGALALKSTQDA